MEAQQSSSDVTDASSEVDSTPLDLGDLYDVLNELNPVLAKWNSIGIALRLKPDILDVIQACNRGDPRSCLTSVVKEWLKRNYDVRKCCEPTWRWLVKAVGEPAGGANMALARDMAGRHKAGGMTSRSHLTQQAHSDTHEPSKAETFARENRQAIITKFAAFQTNLCNKLFRIDVDISQFRLFVVGQFPPGDCIPPHPASLTEIFEAITHHGLWDYFHYSPLVHIAEKFGGGDSEIKGWVQTYKKDLKAYRLVMTVEEHIEADLEIADPPAKRAKYDPCYYRPVEWKTEFIDHSLEYLAKVWELFSARYLMPDSPPTALLDRVRRGCFSVTWLIPSGLIPTLIKRVKIDTGFFRQHRILRVTVGDKCVYEEVTEKRTLGDGLEDLQKIVIQDPQVLFDRITDLVVETFTFDKADPVVREDFKKKGIFPFSTFEKIIASSDRLLTPSRLVNLLEHLHIIAPLEKEEEEEEEGEEGEKRYFMPCILAHAQPASTSRFKRISRAFAAVFKRSAEQSPNNSSLLLGFRCGYCPKGLFAALVVYLLANARSHGHKWTLQRDQIFKDQISFLVRPYDTVSITVQPKFFEITCTPAVSKLSHNRHFPLATTCGEVRCCIETGIREVTSALHYTSDAAHYLAFYCPGKHRGSDPKEPHPAEINFHDNKPCTLQCVLGERGTFELPPGYQRWFTEVRECSGRQRQERQSLGENGVSSPPSSATATESRTSHLRIGEQPTLIELIRFRGRERRINIPQQIGANFMKFGVLLLEDTNGARMQSITHECRDSPEQINTKVLQEWIAGRGRLPVSWDTLIEVLHDVDLGILADDIAAVKCS